jgi:PilZ domain
VQLPLGYERGGLLTIEQNDDRRSAPRFNFEVPVTVSFSGSETTTVSEDLSSHGIQFNVTEEVGSQMPEVIELKLTLGSEVTLSAPQEVWCQARVVRKIRSQIKGVGIAARIESYTRVEPGQA